MVYGKQICRTEYELNMRNVLLELLIIITTT